MGKPFTDATVKNLKPLRDQRSWVEHTDAGCRGLILALSPSGEKVWRFRAMVKGRRYFDTLGGYPEVGLADARNRAIAYLGAARDGISPDAVEARRRAEKLTVDGACGAYLDAHRKALRSQTIMLKEGMWRDHISPVLGKRLLRNVRRADVIEVRDAVQGKGFPVQANRVASEVMAFLRWCEEREWVEGVPSIRRLKSSEKPRERTLTDAETRGLWASSGKDGSLTSDFARMLLLTGQRRDEIREMDWSEVNLADAVWVIPADRYKTGRVQVVPLSEPVLDILRSRWHEGGSGYVLGGRNQGKPFNGHSAALRRIREKLGIRADFTWHDVRRTVRTGLSRIGVDGPTAEMVLGHTPSGIVKVYDQYDRLAEKRDALSRWADYVLSVVGCRGDNVVHLSASPCRRVDSGSRGGDR